MDPVAVAAAIRAGLKAKGITRKQVAVRAERMTTEGAVNVVINDPAVKLDDVQAVAMAHDDVRWGDDGDILGGGNMFVEVHYANPVLAAVAAEVEPVWNRLWDAHKPFNGAPGVTETVTATKGFVLAIKPDPAGANYEPWCVVRKPGDPTELVRCHGTNFAARRLAEIILNGGEKPAARKPAPAPKVNPKPTTLAAAGVAAGKVVLTLVK